METQNSLKTFNYEGNAITFQTGDGVMVNATEMAAQFGKRPIDWLQNQQTHAFLAELSKVRKSTLADLVQVSKGGNNSGTWMHEDVALEFARWLSPKFAIWCNDRIKELLTQGQTSLTDDEVLIMAKALKYADAKLNEQKLQIASQEKMIAAAEREIDRQRVELDDKQNMLDAAVEEIQESHATIEMQKPKADYYDEVLQQQNTYTFTDVAKELGMRSGHELIERLAKRGIIYRKGGKVFAYAKVNKFGYFTTRTDLYKTPDGRKGVNQYTVVTETGRVWLHTDYQTATQNTMNF